MYEKGGKFVHKWVTYTRVQLIFIIIGSTALGGTWPPLEVS